MADNRRAQVTQSGASLTIRLAANPGASLGAIARPFGGGGPTTGFHYQPQVGDEVLAIGETKASYHRSCLSVANPPDLYPLLDGESVILGPQGQVLSHARADGSALVASVAGATIVVSPSGAITLTPAAGQALTIVGNVTLTGDLNQTGNMTISGTINGTPIPQPDPGT